jgi:hypothetical protein
LRIGRVGATLVVAPFTSSVRSHGAGDHEGRPYKANLPDNHAQFSGSTLAIDP